MIQEMEKETITILVCGGREFDDLGLVFKTLDPILDAEWATYGTTQRVKIVTGDAVGADWLARGFAKMRKVKYKGYKPNWNKHGFAAGPIRNKEMLDSEDVDLVVVFPGGNGTKDMMQQAKKRGIQVHEVSY